MRGWHNAGLWREWNVLFCLESFFPFHLDSFFFSNWPSLLSSVLLCVVPASALSLSPRERFDVSPLCRRPPPVPWLVDRQAGLAGLAGLAGRRGSGWGMKASGAARGHLHTEPCLCVCFIFNCFPWPRAELPCQRPSHGRCDLPRCLSLPQFISFRSPSISSSFCPLSFVHLSLYVLWEREQRMTGEFFCLRRVTRHPRQMEFRATEEEECVFNISRSLSSCSYSTTVGA